MWRRCFGFSLFVVVLSLLVFSYNYLFDGFVVFVAIVVVVLSLFSLSSLFFIIVLLVFVIVDNLVVDILFRRCSCCYYSLCYCYCLCRVSWWWMVGEEGGVREEEIV